MKTSKAVLALFAFAIVIVLTPSASSFAATNDGDLAAGSCFFAAQEKDIKKDVFASEVYGGKRESYEVHFDPKNKNKFFSVYRHLPGQTPNLVGTLSYDKYISITQSLLRNREDVRKEIEANYHYGETSLLRGFLSLGIDPLAKSLADSHIISQLVEEELKERNIAFRMLAHCRDTLETGLGEKIFPTRHFESSKNALNAIFSRFVPKTKVTSAQNNGALKTITPLPAPAVTVPQPYVAPPVMKVLK